ncbi:MAG: cysteine desulfurase [Proteobacteria bacterium]|nr:cysteine desulfurase [Pseudomonadota bacterium]
MKEIYLDNAATTRPWPEVIEAMTAVMGDAFGNASSLHRRGLNASRLVIDAQNTVAEVVGGGPWNVIFTSGGSESDTMALMGSVPRGKRNQVVTSTLEHAAVEESCRRLKEQGCAVVVIKAGSRGVVDAEEMAAAVDNRTALVSLIHVASEIGTVQHVADVASRVKAKSKRCKTHVDGVQALAQLPSLNYPPEVDMVSISAHKIHGPQGVGALLLRPDVKPRSLIAGGDQQGGLRPGTFNLPGIVGLGVAMRLLGERRKQAIAAVGKLTDHLVNRIESEVAGVKLLGDRSRRAPGMAVFGVDRVPSEVLLHALEIRGVLASSSSACHSRRKSPPKSLRQAGLKSDQGAVRFSLTIGTSLEEIEWAIEAFIDAVDAIREGRAGEL